MEDARRAVIASSWKTSERKVTSGFENQLVWDVFVSLPGGYILQKVYIQLGSSSICSCNLKLRYILLDQTHKLISKN